MYAICLFFKGMHSTCGAELFHGGSDNVLLLSHAFWADLAFPNLEVQLFFQEENWEIL